ncbi:hypothetical protein ACQFX9_06275 [Aliinostoc sp. HNIBRCY26]|uniref:hypothetical protein n=1 Tax=Aliinostoc sp. HNIBRCY26 TaxID=3418997 RepID=UPI003D01649F
MQFINQNNLFTEISNEEAAAISGGDFLAAATYVTLAKAFGISSDLIKNTALLLLINNSFMTNFLTGSLMSVPGEEIILFRYPQTTNMSSFLSSQI